MSNLSDLYQALILDHSRRPRNFGTLDGGAPVREVEGRNPLCGDELTLQLRVSGDSVSEIAFVGQGCAISKASASVMTAAVKGKSVAEAELLFERFHGLLTGTVAPDSAEAAALPRSMTAFAGVARFPMRVKCASLAWHALHSALAQKNGDDVDAAVSTE
ncbi:MAG TPA: SUF system NifU family Fe-S cluster assembly protein [Gemmatimonadales bacterium]